MLCWVTKSAPVVLLLTILCGPTVHSALVAQTSGATASLAGTITDPSGGVLSNVPITVTPTVSGQRRFGTTTAQGAYEFRGLEPGTYTVTVDISGFALYVKQNVEVRPGQAERLDIALDIAAEKQEVQVSDNGTHVGVTPEENTSAVTITETDLDAFSDDPDELQNELMALAGPSVGPNGGQIYVDGFTIDSGLPPKNSIREIRINQNPFSSQYDRLGYGRIEIITKPGTNKYHARATFDGNDLAFDTRNPFAKQQPGYHSFLTTDDVSGPLGRKASFFANFQKEDIDNNAVVGAVVLDSGFNQVALAQTIPAPDTMNLMGARIDYELTPANSLSVSYQFRDQNQKNLGVGQFSLPSQGYGLYMNEHMVRANETVILGSRFVNQFRFQTQQQVYIESPVSTEAEVFVIGGFVGGGGSTGHLNYHHHHFELDDDATFSIAKHTITFGGRLRSVVEPYVSPGGFNGTYTFGTRTIPAPACTPSATNPCRTTIPALTSYQLTLQGEANGLSPAQIAAQGGEPTQLTLTVGNPYVRMYAEDTGAYVSDDWRLRPNFTLSYGLRFETQNYIKDRADWAPRIALAYGIGRGSNRVPKTVLRAGWGVFYDRFGNQLQLQAEILNGINQTEYVLSDPLSYPNIPTAAQLQAAGAAITTYRVAPNLRTPYTLQAATSIEQQITKAVTVSMTYLNSRGDHAFISNNVNAPLPGTYNPLIPNSGIRPNPALGNIFEYESAAAFEQNQVITNFNLRASRSISLFGFYSFGHVRSDSAGPGSFPDNPYNIAEDYGRAAYDIHHRIVVGGSITMKHGIQLSPLINFQSGTPFNITVGQDLIGSTIFNQRPAFATASTPLADLVATPYGNFNTNPAPGQALIPINYGEGPNNFVANLRVSKTLSFGSRTTEHATGGSGTPSQTGPGGGAGGGDKRVGSSMAGGGGNLGSRGLSNGSGGGVSTSANKRYGLTLSASARNLFNNVNLAAPVGNLTSPLFGKSNGLQGGVYSFASTNRRIDFELAFSF